MTLREKTRDFFDWRKDLDHIHWKEYNEAINSRDTRRLISAQLEVMKNIYCRLPEHFIRGNIGAIPIGMWAAFETDADLFSKFCVGTWMCAFGGLMDIGIYATRSLIRKSYYLSQ